MEGTSHSLLFLVRLRALGVLVVRLFQAAPAGALPRGYLRSMGSSSILAARMKSFSLRPPMAWVQSSTETLR